MTAQLRKEARALLPYWAGTLALIAAPHLLGSRGAGLSWAAYSFGCALLGGLSFGQELQHRTLSLLLSQPLPRAVIWRQKMLVLAAALLTSTAVLVGMSAATGSPSFFEPRYLPFIPLSAWCGAPLLTLLSGSALAGGLFSLAIPGCCLTLAMTARAFFPELDEAAMAASLALLYCAVAGVLGYRRFRTHEARDSRSLSLGLPAWLLPRTSPAPGRPLVVLLRKELRLQHGTVVFAIVLWGSFFIWALLARAGGGDWRQIAWVVTWVDLLVLPLVAGALAIGEERSLGVADWQLSLPPSARLQWLAKMMVALPSSLVLGLAVPLLVRGEVPSAQVLAVLVAGHLLLTHFAIYAGSLSRGTVPAILLALGFWTAIGIAGLSSDLAAKLEATPKVALALAPMIVLLQSFAFSNYRRRGLRLGRIGLQGGVAAGGLLATFAMLLGV